jgi:hypothetical protein
MRIGDDFERYFVIGRVGVFAPRVKVKSRRPPGGADDADPFNVFKRNVSDFGKARYKRGFFMRDFNVIFRALFKRIDRDQNLFFLIVGDIAPHAADHIDRVVDAVAGQLREKIHNDFAVAPGIHQKRVETYFMSGDAEPEQMAVDAFQLAYQRAYITSAGRNHKAGDFLYALNEAGRVRVRTDAAYPFQKINVLNVGSAFRRLFDAPVVVSKLQINIDQFFSVQRDRKTRRFLHGRMLRPHRDLYYFLLIHIYSFQSLSIGYCPSGQSSGRG